MSKKSFPLSVCRSPAATDVLHLLHNLHVCAGNRYRRVHLACRRRWGEKWTLAAIRAIHASTADSQTAAVGVQTWPIHNPRSRTLHARRKRTFSVWCLKVKDHCDLCKRLLYFVFAGEGEAWWKRTDAPLWSWNKQQTKWRQIANFQIWWNQNLDFCRKET